MARPFLLRPATLAIAALVAGSTVALATAPPASEWQIGPVIRGRTFSQGMPSTPTPVREGWAFEFPYPDRSAGHVHYVTTAPGSLTGATKIVVRYRVNARRGVRFIPQEFPDRTPTVSLVIQRAGDNWSAKGRYEFYRWYAPEATVQSLSGGVRQMTVSLSDPQWSSVMATPASANPRAFADALANAGQVGLVFGSDGGRGHGVYATGPARFTLLRFDVE